MLENPITHINVYKPPPNKTLTTNVTYEDILTVITIQEIMVVSIKHQNVI